MRKTLAVLTLTLAPALAQGEGIPPNLADCFVSQASLAAVVAALVALVRKHIWRSLDGAAVVGFSVALGIVLAYLSHLGEGWFTSGLVSGLIASGGVDALRAIAKGGGSGAPEGAGGAPPNAERSRLR
jgi:hypothetical protein